MTNTTLIFDHTLFKYDEYVVFAFGLGLELGRTGIDYEGMNLDEDGYLFVTFYNQTDATAAKLMFSDQLISHEKLTERYDRERDNPWMAAHNAWGSTNSSYGLGVAPNRSSSPSSKPPTMGTSGWAKRLANIGQSMQPFGSLFGPGSTQQQVAQNIQQQSAIQATHQQLAHLPIVPTPAKGTV